MQNVAKLRWWALICTIVAGLFVACYEGAATFFWHADATKLSFVIWGLFFIISSFVGYLTFKQGTNMAFDVGDRVAVDLDKEQHLRYINACWYGTELLMGMGLIGTVLGIIMMFSNSAGGLDPSNVASMKLAIVSMSTGLTTAFVTTLSGIMTSQLLKLQLINYEVDQK